MTDQRRIFIGDIQGCREELERLLQQVTYDPARDTLFPAGDLVNRGPDSLGTLRLLRQLDAQPVLGNHDLHLLRVTRGTRALRPSDTLAEVLAAEDRNELCEWLAAAPFVRRFDDLFLLHAGLDPRWEDPLEACTDLDPFRVDERSDFVTRVRTCDAGGARPDAEGAPGFAPWFQHYDPDRHGGRTVVFGHWAARGLVLEPHLRGLDTGCVWGGHLTAWIAEEDRIEQVRAARSYARVGRD